MKKLILLGVLSSTVLLTGCSKPTEEELARQETYEENVKAAPEWTDEEEEMINESRGVVIDEEKNEDDEVVEVINSFSPGEDAVHNLASLTKEELLKLDDLSLMEIFINGVIRDEYKVAAYTLYGDEMHDLKEEFKKSLLAEMPKDKNDDEDAPPYTYADKVGLESAIQDDSVVRNHVDELTKQLNRVYVKIVPKSNFGSKVTLKGEVYPIELGKQLERIENDTFEYTGVNPSKNRSLMNEKDLKILHDYYDEIFVNAMTETEISVENSSEAEIGGFVKREDGTWVPAQMSIFALNVVKLVYGID